MVTNSVSDLISGAGAWNMVLNAQGRIQGDLTVWREEDKLELEIAAHQYDRLLAHLERFIIWMMSSWWRMIRQRRLLSAWSAPRRITSWPGWVFLLCQAR